MKDIIFWGLLLSTVLLCLECKTKPSKSLYGVRQTGFEQDQYRNGPGKFPDSEYASDLSPLEALKTYKKGLKEADVKIIDINDKRGCKNWKECGINNKKYRHFLIMPGDYRAWGALNIRVSGTKTSPRIITYYNPSQNNPYEPQLPVHTSHSSKQHVRLEAFDFVKANYWIINGLTFSGYSKKTKRGKIGGQVNRFAASSNYNIINRCLFEHIIKHNAIRIEASHYNCVQNSIIRHLIGEDQVGIVLKGGNARAIGNRIVGNEIYDCNDGVQLTYKDKFAPNGFLSGTIIENNDIYLTSNSYSKRKSGFACAENAIDIKIGGESAAPKDVVRILRNRIWGFRPTDTSCGGSGSHGTGIGTHMKANNIIIKDNIIFDLPGGIGISNAGVRNSKMAIINNLIFNIKKFNRTRNYAPAIRASVDTDIYYNTIKDAEESLFVAKRSAGRVQCNTILGIPQKFRWESERKGWSALNAWYGCNVGERGPYSHNSRLNVVDNRADQSKFGDFIFYRKRWTKPEKVIVKNIFPNNKNQIGRVSSPNNYCGKGGEGGRWWISCVK